jgi:hypothetical protein
VLIGAGAIGISAVWTLAKLVRPVAAGLRSAMAASSARQRCGALLPRTEGHPDRLGGADFARLHGTDCHAADELGVRSRLGGSCCWW